MSVARQATGALHIPGADYLASYIREPNVDQTGARCAVGVYDTAPVFPADFDPALRDCLIAGAMLPGSLVRRPQNFPRWFRARMLEVIEDVDVIAALATPTVATRIGQVTIGLAG